ncbi:MAG TPA: hypothetical protein VJ349_19815, partial [Stellaceae bacterium]|nr:hypothetical protein [Stellaceae bacterium]
PAGRSHLLRTLWPSSQRCLHRPQYPASLRCDKLNVPPGQRRHCFSFGGKRIDGIVAAEILRAVAPMAIEAAEEAERMLRDEDQDDGASPSWSCNRPSTKHRWHSVAMPLATPTIA